MQALPPCHRLRLVCNHLEQLTAIVKFASMRLNSRRFIATVIILILCCLIAACANENVLKDQPGANGSVAGFWRGLWQGLILPFSFVVSLFRDDVNIYEVRNNGGWYNLGFIWGALLIFGGGGAGASGKRGEKDEG